MSLSEVSKTELRKHFKDNRLARTSDEISYIDHKVYSFFVDCDEYKKCHDILIYVSGDIEIGTKNIMEHVFNDIAIGYDKRLLCPRCEKGTNIMHFYLVSSFDDLEKGSFGILEPKESCVRVDDLVEPICVVPALSFDSKGYRLGFGKGFYDRFLADFKGITIGLCCESCMTEGVLPHDEYDIRVDRVVTELGWVITPQTEYKRKG